MQNSINFSETTQLYTIIAYTDKALVRYKIEKMTALELSFETEILSTARARPLVRIVNLLNSNYAFYHFLPVI